MADWFTDNAPKPAPAGGPPAATGGNWFQANAPQPVPGPSKPIAVDPDAVRNTNIKEPSEEPLPSFTQPEGTAEGRLARGVWDSTLGAIGGLAKTLMHLSSVQPGQVPSLDAIEDVHRMIQGHIDQARKAKEAWQNGHQVEAAGHAAAAAMPLIGPAAAAVGEKFGGEAPQFDKYGNVVKSGRMPDVAGATGEGLGLVGSTVAPGAVKAVLPESVAVGPIVKSTLNPVEESSVEFLQDRGVPLSVGTQTGNRFIKSVQATTGHSPLGAEAAAEATRATEHGLTRVASELADETHPEPATPASAGASVLRKLKGRIEDIGGQEDEAYSKAWEHRDNPDFTYELPVRTEQVADPKNPGKTIDQPVMKKVNMPVDVRDIKATLKPVWEEMQYMPAAEQASSAGFQAIKNILKGDDFIPAWQAERGLSGLKTMARTQNLSGVRNVSQGIGAQIVPALQDGIDAAVANTGEDAIRGLQDGRALHASKMEVANIADQLREEPVQTFNKLTWRGDTGVEFLKKVAKQASEVMPEIGRAYVDQLFDQATREGGFSKTRTLLSQWENLGPQTKQLLFPDAMVRSRLDKFFKAAEMVAQNPNPSGTALTEAANSVNPVRWAIGYTGSKLLYTPRGARILTDSFQIPLGGSRGRIAAGAVRNFMRDIPPDRGAGVGAASNNLERKDQQNR